MLSFRRQPSPVPFSQTTFGAVLRLPPRRPSFARRLFESVALRLLPPEPARPPLGRDVSPIDRDDLKISVVGDALEPLDMPKRRRRRKRSPAVPDDGDMPAPIGNAPPIHTSDPVKPEPESDAEREERKERRYKPAEGFLIGRTKPQPDEPMPSLDMPAVERELRPLHPAGPPIIRSAPEVVYVTVPDPAVSSQREAMLLLAIDDDARARLASDLARLPPALRPEAAARAREAHEIRTQSIAEALAEVARAQAASAVNPSPDLGAAP